MYGFDPDYFKQNDYLHEPLVFENVLTRAECNKIVKQSIQNLEMTHGEVESGNEDEDAETAGVHTDIRIVDKYEFYFEPDVVPFTSWLYPKLEELIMNDANSRYEFDIAGIGESVNLLHYHTTPAGGGHYVPHVDFGPSHLSTRKLTCIIQLSRPEQYEGCELHIPEWSDECAPQEQGTAILFPPWMLHHVTPLISGDRYCLNLWANGPAFR